MEKVTIYTDGACRGNPGPAGAGALILDGKGQPIAEISEFLGNATNNIAEYTALIKALEKTLALGIHKAEIFTDSQLLVKQVLGEYKVKNEGLKSLYQRVKELEQQFEQFAISHVPREKNKLADKLANKGIDQGNLGR
ncbi:MAG: ribonuclease HI family protein [Bacillota bacterium]